MVVIITNTGPAQPEISKFQRNSSKRLTNEREPLERLRGHP
jgi:hypothetical protein